MPSGESSGGPLPPRTAQTVLNATPRGEELMAGSYIHTCYRVLDPERSEDFSVNKLACRLGSAKSTELRFRALLAEGGTERLELTRA